MGDLVKDGLEGAAAAVLRLPVLAPSAARLAGAATAESPSPRRVRLVEAIEAEPALALAVLAHSGAETVPKAVDATPISTLAAIARSARTMDPLSGADPWMAHLRLHSLAVRAVAERVAGAAGDDVDAAIASALLHDLGKLALRETSAATGSPTSARPRSASSTSAACTAPTTHGVGAEVLRSLGIHPGICERVEHHHSENGPGITLRVADALCHYAHGHPIRMEELVALSARAGISRAAAQRASLRTGGPGVPAHPHARPEPAVGP